MPNSRPQPSRTTAPKGPGRVEQDLAAWDRWETAAKNWKGLDVRLSAKAALRNITETRSGYQVRIYRGAKEVFSRNVRGHTEESVFEAMQIRDEALRLWPSSRQRKYRIPPWVLKGLGLTEPVIGVNRVPGRSMYRVDYRDSGRSRVRYFYFRVVPEEVAYAAAIDFLESTLGKDNADSVPD